MSWESDELTAARKLVAEADCRLRGHDFSVIVSMDNEPRTVYCRRCGRCWEMPMEDAVAVAATERARRIEETARVVVGMQGQFVTSAVAAAGIEALVKALGSA